MKSSDNNTHDKNANNLVNDLPVPINQRRINIEKYDASVFEKEKIPYTFICNKVIQNITDIQAGFVWIYLQSLPATWVPNKFHLMSHFKISERTYQRIMSYLSEVNLIAYTRCRNKNGTLGAVRLIVKNGSEFALPLDSNHTAKICIVDFNHTAKKPQCGETTAVVFGDHINTIIPIKEKEKEINTICRKEVACENFSLSQMLEDNPFNIPQDVLTDWLEVRRIKKAKMTRTSWSVINSTLKKLVGSGLNAIECFETMVASGWQGMKVSYFQREIDSLKKNLYKENEQKIREREVKREEEKKIEIEQSKEFKNITTQITQRIDLDLLRQKQEAERIALGMTAMEYHKHLLCFDKKI